MPEDRAARAAADRTAAALAADGVVPPPLERAALADAAAALDRAAAALDDLPSTDDDLPDLPQPKHRREST